MKKIFGIAVAIMLGINMIGCEDTMEDTIIEEPVTKQEEQNEVEEKEETIEEEIVEEPEEEVEVDAFDEEEFKYYMTTNLQDAEYETYFESIKWIGDQPREIEFDGHILIVTPHEKWNTRCELLLANGDYNNGEFDGPYIKTRDIAYTELNGMINEGYNVRVKATIEKYDINAGYLKITIKEITAR